MAWQGKFPSWRGKGAAKGKPGRQFTRSPKRARANTTMSTAPYVEPVLMVDPGRGGFRRKPTIAFEGAIKHETDSPSKILNFPFSQSAETDRCSSMVPRRAIRSRSLSRASCRGGPQPRGHHGHHAGIRRPGRPTGSHRAAQSAIAGAGQESWRSMPRPAPKWNDKITLPYEPFIGTIGTSPENRGDLVAGAGLLWRQTWICPNVRSRRGDLSARQHQGRVCSIIGDCHAAQGDGELCGRRDRASDRGPRCRST